MARRWRWAGNQNSIAVVAGTHQAVSVLNDDVLEKGETISRIIGEISWNLVSVSAANRRVACGLIVAPQGMGSSAFPDPLADFDADWIWFNGAVLSPHVEVADFQTRDLLVDNRAMRKVGSDESLFMVASVQTSTTNLSWVLRVGLKLV